MKAPAAGARTRAEQLLEQSDRPCAVCTDIESKPGQTVFVGIAVRDVGSVLLAVDWAEWDEDWKRNLEWIDPALTAPVPKRRRTWS